MIVFAINICLIMIYLLCERCFENKLIQFFIGFIPFCLNFFLRISKFYFKCVSVIFVFLKSLIFKPILPLIFQYAVTFHITFNFFWDGYLLLSVYSIIFYCFPYYFYSFLKSLVRIIIFISIK